MGSYDIGYGKPPLHTRFKIGNTANLAGRPRRKTSTAGELIESGLNGTAQYTEGGRAKTASWFQLGIKKTVNEALKGNLKAAAALLRLLKQLNHLGETEAPRVMVQDWAPEHAGQTGEQKTRQLVKRNQTGSIAQGDDGDEQIEDAQE